MSTRDTRLLQFLLLTFYLFLVLRNAWISDDAYITFRVIENFLAGYGLTYNPFVRVQAYTHPAWMFLLSGVYRLEWKVFPYSENALYFVAIFTSIIVSALAVWILLSKIASKDWLTGGLTIAALTLSRAFVDYSTSGLENPLTHLLLALFLWVYFIHPQKWFLLALVSSFLFLNRQDAILLVLPPLALVFFVTGEYPRKLKMFLLGFLPLILWELFSLFYYGFLFPNTAYAKLNTGISSSLLLQQGLDYLLNSLHWDPLTLFVIACAGAAAFLGEPHEESRKIRFLVLGVLLYVLYVVKIGGDFMSGRFFTAPLVLAVAILARSALSRRNLLAILGIVTALGVVSLRSTLLDPEVPALYHPTLRWTENLSIQDRSGIADERAVYFSNQPHGIYLGLVEEGFRDAQVGSKFAGVNWRYSGDSKVIVDWSIGRLGYSEGPNKYIVDNYGLADPLMARLPVTRKKWRIGHFARELPAGYIETLQSGEDRLADPNLARFYAELRSVIEGPLWSWERMVKIWKFNTGQYDDLITLYLSSLENE